MTLLLHLNSDMEHVFKDIVDDRNERVPEMTVDSLNKMFKISDIKRGASEMNKKENHGKK